MSSELVRIDMNFVNDVATSAFFPTARSIQFSPFVMSGRRVFDERP